MRIVNVQIEMVKEGYDVKLRGNRGGLITQVIPTDSPRELVARLDELVLKCTGSTRWQPGKWA